jgi:hypothetical protein
VNLGVIDGITRTPPSNLASGWEIIANQTTSAAVSAVRFSGLTAFRELRLSAKPITSATNYLLWRANGDATSTYSGIGYFATNNPGSGTISQAGGIGYPSAQALSSNLILATWANPADVTRYRVCLWQSFQARVSGIVTYWMSGGSDWQSTGQPIDFIDLYMASGTFLSGSTFRMEGLR